MKTKLTIDGRNFKLDFVLTGTEQLTGKGQGRAPITLITNSCQLTLPSEIGEIHPDLLALAVLVLVKPWVGDTLTFDHPISAAMADTLAQHHAIEAGPIDPHLRQRSPGSEIGLSFSGGADSIAVSELLPDSSPHIHFRRVPHPRVVNRATHLRVDVTERLVTEMGKRGLNTMVVESDMEFMVGSWPQFSTWPSLSVGAILLADQLDLGAVSYGTILGARYLKEGTKFTPIGAFDAWAEAFAAAGLPHHRPAAGMSEIVTYRLTQESRFADLSRSCALGTDAGPCLRCSKCIRKQLIAAAAAVAPLNPVLLQRLEGAVAIKEQFLTGPPFYCQHIVEYCMARVPGLADTFLEPMLGLFDLDPRRTDFLERAYRPAIKSSIPSQWQAAVLSALDGRVGFMTEAEEHSVETWDGVKRAKAPR